MIVNQAAKIDDVLSTLIHLLIQSKSFQSPAVRQSLLQAGSKTLNGSKAIQLHEKVEELVH